LEGIPELEFTADARDLASRFLAESAIPAKSLDDAIHVAIATVNGMDFLATWNCRHIVNAQGRRVFAAHSLHPRTINGKLNLW
jgi:hypothetical protein